MLSLICFHYLITKLLSFLKKEIVWWYRRKNAQSKNRSNLKTDKKNKNDQFFLCLRFNFAYYHIIFKISYCLDKQLSTKVWYLITQQGRRRTTFKWKRELKNETI